MLYTPAMPTEYQSSIEHALHHCATGKDKTQGDMT